MSLPDPASFLPISISPHPRHMAMVYCNAFSPSGMRVLFNLENPGVCPTSIGPSHSCSTRLVLTYPFASQPGFPSANRLMGMTTPGHSLTALEG